MPFFNDWLLHRARIVGLSWPDGVADASGVDRTILESILPAEDLRDIGRSARAYIARALKVSLRELEALAAGRIPWIGDDRIVDFERLSPNSINAVRFVAPAAVACGNSHGVPILGRIVKTGAVEHDEPWTPEDGARLCVRYPSVPDAFSLELMVDACGHCAGTCLVFQAIAPADFCDGDLALLTRGQVEAETGFGIVRHQQPGLLRFTVAKEGAERSVIVAMGDVLRAARVIGVCYREAVDSLGAE